MDNSSLFYFFTGPVLIGLAVFTLISIIGVWQVFVKAGKPGWAAIIPIYNLIVYLEIVGKPLWWIILLIIPYVNYIFYIWTLNRLSKSFGQGVGFTVGLVLLHPIFICILGFGSAQYLGPDGVLPNYGAGDYERPFDINPTK